MVTPTPQTIEGSRREEQARLDRHKTAAERNKQGQFATPPELARSLADYALSLIGKETLRFLDPAIGTGSFYSALSRAVPASGLEVATGIELDPLFAAAAKKLWSRSGLHIIQGDFTKQGPPALRFNLILTNPPYVRHHHLESAKKQRLKEQLAQMLHMETRARRAVLLLSITVARLDGRQRPRRLADSLGIHGCQLRRYAQALSHSERVTLVHIHRFCCPTDVQFSDAFRPIFRRS